MTRTLIVGFGHAGRDVHLPPLRRLFGAVDVGLVDPDPSVRTAVDGPVRWYANLAQAKDFDPDTTVVHVCTPPYAHLPVLREAAALGYRRIIVEKPLGSSLAEARAAADLCASAGVDVLVLANWLSSALTDRLRALVVAQAPTSAVLGQSKPRIDRSLANSAHRSALEVEMPHLVALATHLFGPRPRVLRARVWDLHVNGVRVHRMGGARADLVAAGGIRIRIESDLTAPVIHRSVRLEFPDGSIARGYYPADSRELYSQLRHVDAEGREQPPQFLADDVVERFLAAAYGWFAGTRPCPVSTAALHVDVCATLDDIAQAAESGPAPDPEGGDEREDASAGADGPRRRAFLRGDPDR